MRYHAHQEPIPEARSPAARGGAAAFFSRLMTWAADRLVVAGLALAFMAVIAEPDGITRLIGLEMLRIRMIEQRGIDTQPAGYQGVGYAVRVG